MIAFQFSDLYGSASFTEIFKLLIEQRVLLNLTRTSLYTFKKSLYWTIFKPSKTPIWNGKQNSLTGPVITGSFEKRAPGVETQQNIELMTFALTWCADIFVGCSVTLTFFTVDHFVFLILSIILRNKKNVYVGSFNYFSYTIQIRPNWYMDTGVRDLEVAFFKTHTPFTPTKHV